MAFRDVMLGPEPAVQTYMKFGHTQTGYWFDAFGWIVYYFAQIEWASYVVIDKLELPAQRPSSTALLFKRRCQRAEALMAAYLTDAQLAADWADFWADAIAAAVMRNKILHNPFTIALDGRDVATPHDGIKLMQDPARPVVGLGRVQAFGSQLIELAQRMHQLFARTQLPV